MSSLIAVFGLACLLPVSAVEGLTSNQDPNLVAPRKGRPVFVPNEVLVGFHPGGASRADQVRIQFGAQKLDEWPGLRAQHWRLTPGWDVARAIEVLSRNPNVEYAEPNAVHAAADFPLDPGCTWRRPG